MPITATGLRTMMRQLQEIEAKPVDCVHVYPPNDVSELRFDLDGPEGTPFAAGRFHVVLCFDEHYPEVPPKGFFRTKIFHPNVSERGEICVNALKKDWSPALGLRHVLMVIRCLLVEPNPESALNDEAGRLLLEDYGAYERKAIMLTNIHAKRPPGAPRFRSDEEEESTAKKGGGTTGAQQQHALDGPEEEEEEERRKKAPRPSTSTSLPTANAGNEAERVENAENASCGSAPAIGTTASPVPMAASPPPPSTNAGSGSGGVPALRNVEGNSCNMETWKEHAALSVVAGGGGAESGTPPADSAAALAEKKKKAAADKRKLALKRI